MKSLLFGLLVFVGACSALAAPKELVRCKVETSDFHRGYSPFPQESIAGEYTLVDLENKEYYLPSKLEVQLFYYVSENGTPVRKRMAGGQLSRIGYTVLGDTVTFSYMSFNGSNHPSFQISTNGKESVMTFSQTGSSSRDWSSVVDCEILDQAPTAAPVIDTDKMSDVELSTLISKLAYNRGELTDVVAFDKQITAGKAAVIARIDSTDYAKMDSTVDTFKWDNADKCGQLQIANKNWLVNAVKDGQKNIVGYVLRNSSCTGTISMVKYKWKPDTGERYEVIEKRRPYVSNLLFDKNFRLLNLDLKENGLAVGFDLDYVR